MILRKASVYEHARPFLGGALIFSLLLSPLVSFAQVSGANDSSSQESPTLTESGGETSDTPSLNVDPGFSLLSSGDGGASRSIDTSAQSLRFLENDEFTGAFLYQYEFKLPPGRNGLTPELELLYNSSAKNNDSYIGYGWELNIPYIQRANLRGTERLYSTEDYVSSLEGELTKISTTTYRAKIDNGATLSYTYNSNGYWTVYDKEGTRYRFGQTASARQDDATTTTRIYKWMLEEVRDTNDNFIKYEYFKDAGQIYPSKITYTGHGSTAGIFEVIFNRQAYEMSPAMYFADFSVESNYKVTSIEIRENGSWVRKYEFAHGGGAASGRSVLASITESGRDLVAGTTASKSPTTFTYKTANPTIEWTQTTGGAWELPLQFYDRESQDPTLMQLRDVNGDGYPDVVYAEDSADPPCTYNRVYLNNARGGWTDSSCPTEWYVPVWLKDGDNAFADYGTRVFDYDGDLLPDLVRSYASTSGPGVDVSSVYRNTGVATTSWTSTAVTVPIGFVFGDDLHADNSTQVLDVNGDGLADILRGHLDDDGEGLQTISYLNNGNGWTATTTVWQLPYGIIDENSSGTEVYTYAQFMDLNGDALPDYVFRHEDNEVGTKLGINNGHGWTLIPFTSIPLATQGEEYLSSGKADAGTRSMDLNGDGILDLILSVDSGSGVSASAYLSQQNDSGRFSSEINPTMPLGFAYPNDETIHTAIVDINADGVDDLLYAERNADEQLETETYLSNASPFTDLLVGVNTAEGASTTVNYKLSTKYFDGSDNLLNPELPAAIVTVESVVTNDGLGNLKSESYTYADGMYYYNDPFDRRFAGFGLVTRTDSIGSITKTYFHQGNESSSTIGEYNDHISKRGKPYRVEQYDSLGNLYTKTINTWDRFDLGSGASFVKLTKKLEFAYDGDVDHKEKGESFAYHNNTGNMTEHISWGQVTGSDNGTFTDTGTDKFVTTFAYATSTGTTTPVFYRPSRETVVDQSSAKVRESRFYYDSLSLGSVAVGNLTKEERWKSGSSYIDVERTYNSYGLITQEKDPRDKVTTYTYDTYNLYPATTTNPLSHAVAQTYDYSSGQVHQTIDQNGRVFQTFYDPFDRVREVKEPDLLAPSTVVTKHLYVYTDTGMPRRIKRTDYLDSVTSVDTYTYVDAFERKVEERIEAEGTNTFTVKSFAYNKRGLLQSESLPYFGIGTSYSGINALPSSSLQVDHLYDSLERLTRTTTAIGTTTQAYDDWKRTVTDPAGKIKDFTHDAYGNLASVIEHDGSNLYTTAYSYNGNNKLTKITDAEGNIRNFTYDGLGRQLTAEDLHDPADGSFGIWTYTYDDAGNLTTTVNPKSQNIARTYDDLNRALTEDLTTQAGTEVTYAYDTCAHGKGRLCTAGTLGATTTYIYNAHGLVKEEAKAVSSVTYTTQYSYDRLGNKTKIVYPDASEVKYTYNTAGLLETIEEKEGGGVFLEVVADFDYAPTGQVSYKQFANGVESTYTYDSEKLYRLTNILTTPSAGGGLLGMLDFPALATAVEEVLPFAFAPLATLVVAIAEEVSETAQDIFEEEVPTEAVENADTPNESLAEEVATTTENTEIVPPVMATTTEPVATTTAPVATTTPSLGTATSSEPTPSVEDSPATTTAATTSPEIPAAVPPAEQATTSVEMVYEQNASLKAEYAIKGNAFTKESDKLTVTVGAPDSPTFVPAVRLERWRDAAFSLTYPGSQSSSARLSSENEKIIWNGVNEQVRFYELSASEELPEGGYEIDVVFPSKPASNVVSFDISSENLDFFYQGPLDEEEHGDDVMSCTATECVNAEDAVIVRRPEHVVGSYAAYYKNGISGNYSGVGGADYGTGKAFHIYRPKITDAAGNTTWGTLSVSTVQGKLTVTVPQEFLNTAVYPVIVDPTFGYGLVGASSADTANPTGSKYGITENGTITQVSFYTKAATGTVNVGAAVYSNNLGYPENLLTSQTATPSQGTTASWVNVPVADFTAATGTSYWLWGASSGSRTVYWDSGNVNQYQIKAMTWPTWDNPVSGGTFFARKMSIYATYTASSTSSSPIEKIQDITFTYDKVGNITQINDVSQTGAGKRVDYGYDDLHRLTSAVTATASSTAFNHTYAYNSLGNITSKSDVGSYTYAETNYANPHAATSIAGMSLTYDNNGNVTAYNGSTYTWDYRNRLTAAGSGGATTTYAYDHNNLRTKKSVGGVTTIYPNELYNKAGSTVTKHIYAGSDLIATIEGNGTATSTRYVHSDHLGSTNAVTDDSGEVVQTLDYYPFGSERIDLGTDVSQKQYIGQEYDEETDLAYLNARYYVGQRGQFTSQDPVFLKLGQDPRTDSFLGSPQAQNSYSYAMNNPITYKDPTGEEPNKVQTATLAQVMETMRAVENSNQGVGYKNVVSAMATHFSSSNEIPRFIYTETAGWLDMRHFIAATESMQTRGETLTRLAGISVEILQSLGADKGSAFSYEDLPSNSEGMGFAQFLKDEIKNNPKASVSNTLDAYLQTLNPQAPEDAPNYNSLMESAYDEPTGNSNSTSKNKDFKK